MLVEAQAKVALACMEFPSAIIAGGFPRDVLFGKPAKDIDVFVPGLELSSESFDAKFMDTADRLGGSVSALPSSFTAEDGTAAHEVTKQGVIDFPHDPSRLPVNIIALNMEVTVDTLMKRSDVRLCQAWYDLTRDACVGTGDAFRDFSEKRLTIVDNADTEAEFRRTVRRCLRFQATKYPGFTIVNESSFDLNAALESERLPLEQLWSTPV